MPKSGAERFAEVVRVSTNAQARALLAASESRVVIVERNYPRSVCFACPCGCHDILVINVDPSVGKAWRLREGDLEVTLMPSVSRPGGCYSHFVVWRNQIWWCDFDDAPCNSWPAEMDAELRDEWRRLARGSRR